jgi:hypothetical protein
LINDQLVIPTGICQKVLQHLVVRIRNRLSYTFHILFLGLDESFEILFGDAADIARTQLKQWRISAMKIDKMSTYAPEGAVVMVNSFLSCSIVLAGCWY